MFSPTSPGSFGKLSKHSTKSFHIWLLITWCFYGNSISRSQWKLEAYCASYCNACIVRGSQRMQVTQEKFSYFKNDVLRLNVLWSKVHRRWGGLRHNQMMWINELTPSAVCVFVPHCKCSSTELHEWGLPSYSRCAVNASQNPRVVSSELTGTITQGTYIMTLVRTANKCSLDNLH